MRDVIYIQRNPRLCTMYSSEIMLANFLIYGAEIRQRPSDMVTGKG